MKRSLLAALASAALATTAFAPAASAQNPLDIVNSVITGMDCNSLRAVLTTTGVKGDAETRSELVSNLRGYAGDNVQLKLMLNTNINAVADRAVSCNIVKADAPLPAGSAQFAQYADFLSIFSSEVR